MMRHPVRVGSGLVPRPRPNLQLKLAATVTNRMVDPDTFEKAVTAVENDPEVVRLIIKAVTGDHPPSPEGLDYHPVMMEAVVRSDEISKGIFQSDDAFDYARVFHEADMRIRRKCFPLEMSSGAQTGSVRRGHALISTLARIGRLLLPKKGK
jgi:hypothetical protein